MSQPIWQYLFCDGDANPILYGGVFVYRDVTGVYQDEAEYVDPYEQHGEVKEWRIWRYPIDRLKCHPHPDTGRPMLIPRRYQDNWPHAAHSYEEWFSKDIGGVCSYIGMEPDTFREHICGEDPWLRSRAWQSVGDYWGFMNLDSYPLIIKDREEMWKRYARELCKHRNIKTEDLLMKCVECGHVQGVEDVRYGMRN
jgi:hypothetical protein